MDLTTELKNLRDDEDQGHIGIFPSWKALYWTVIVYTVLLVVILWIFTVTLDFHVL